jgi:hypothetical protein
MMAAGGSRLMSLQANFLDAFVRFSVLSHLARPFSPWKHSERHSTALSIQPTEQNCHRPRVLTEVVPRPPDDAEVGRAVRIGDRPGIGLGHELIAAAVDQ